MRLSSMNRERTGKAGFTRGMLRYIPGGPGSILGTVGLGATHEKRFAPSAIRRRGCYSVSGVDSPRWSATGRAVASGTPSTSGNAKPCWAEFDSAFAVRATDFRRCRSATFGLIGGNSLCRHRWRSTGDDSDRAQRKCKDRGAWRYAHPSGIAQRYFDSQRETG
jgi:hypothetical protein